MFFNIFKSEIKYQLKNIIIWIIFGIAILMYVTQFGIYTSGDDFKPQPGHSLFYTINTNQEMETVEELLEKDLARDKYSKYILAEKNIEISPEDKKEMKKIKKDLESGNLEHIHKKINELDYQLGSNTIYGNRWRVELYSRNLAPQILKDKILQHLREDLGREQVTQYYLKPEAITLPQKGRRMMEDIVEQLKENKIEYNEMINKLDKLDQRLDGETAYGPKWREILLTQKASYDQKIKRFKKQLEMGLMNVYGRLFADYLGIDAGFFTIFIGAFLLTRDRRTNMLGLIKSRNIKPLTYVGAKYLAVVFLLSLIYLLVSLHPTIVFYKICSSNNWDIHIFGFIKYVIGWIVPTIMFTVAITIMLTELTGNGLLAVAVQIPWCISSLLPLKGNYSLSKYIIRFNSTTAHQLFQQSVNQIWFNRIFYLLLTAVLVLFSSWLWSKKDITEKRGYNVLRKAFKNVKV